MPKASHIPTLGLDRLGSHRQLFYLCDPVGVDHRLHILAN
jgi:hypothetical protein